LKVLDTLTDAYT